MTKLRLFLLLLLLVIFSGLQGQNKPGNIGKTQSIDVAAFYWPAYHPAERFREISVFPDGNGEWEAIYKSKPKFAGEQVPKVPLWGYQDESDPNVMQQKIEAATKYGVNTFIFDWYWYTGKPYLEECINNGFLNASNNQKMKFYLMWANHDHNSYLDPANPDKNKIYWKGGVDSLTFVKMIDHVIIDYFKKPNYYQIDHMPVFSIYELGTFIKGIGGTEKAREALAIFRKKTIAAGFPGLHLQAIVWGQIPKSLETFVRLRETENIRIGNRLCSQSRTHRVPQNPADSRRRPAVRVERGWMIMRLDFEADRVGIIEFYYARVIFKNAYTPVFVELFRGAKNRIFYKIIEMNLLAFKIEVNAAL